MWGRTLSALKVNEKDLKTYNALTAAVKTIKSIIPDTARPWKHDQKWRSRTSLISHILPFQNLCYTTNNTAIKYLVLLHLTCLSHTGHHSTFCPPAEYQTNSGLWVTVMARAPPSWKDSNWSRKDTHQTLEGETFKVRMCCGDEGGDCVVMVTIKSIQLHLLSATGQLSGRRWRESS